VLSAQKALIALCTETSGLSIQHIHVQTCVLLRQELKQIGMDVLARDLEQVLFPHYVAHPIGLGQWVMPSSKARYL
jgi:intermediate cleaving peptidase 55